MSKVKKKKNAEGEEVSPELRARREIYDWIQCLATALIICVILFVFFIRIIDVSGTSMYPTLNNGDKMLVSDLFYTPKVGDIVVFKSDTYDPDKALVKRSSPQRGRRSISTLTGGLVYVDGVAIEEDYISELTTTKLDFIGPKTVPEGCVFVMGDNRNMSTDSRKAEIGMVDNRLILGRVYCVLFPLSELGWVK